MPKPLDHLRMKIANYLRLTIQQGGAGMPSKHHIRFLFAIVLWWLSNRERWRDGLPFLTSYVMCNRRDVCNEEIFDLIPDWNCSAS